MNRLQQIVQHAILNGFLGILEIIEPTEDNCGGVKSPLGHIPEQLKAIHLGHFDVRDDNIHPMLIQPLQCLPAVRCAEADLKAEGGPVNQIPETFSGDTLVVYDHYCHHSSVPPLLGIRKLATVYCPWIEYWIP